MNKKIIGIFVCILFSIPILICVSGIALEGEMKITAVSNMLETSYDDILFSDDFNDNQKDYNKWMEIYSSGIWEETNSRAEFQLTESGGTGARSEGIQSTGIQAMIGGDEPWEKKVEITWIMHPTIDSTSTEGKAAMKVTDGRNYIMVEYDRTGGVARYNDNLGNSGEFIGGDEPWENKLEILGDKYFVTMNMQSATVDNTIFSTVSVTLNVQLFIELGGSTRTNYLRSGFDDIIVRQITSENQPPTKPSISYNKANDELVVSSTDPDNDQIRYGVSWDNDYVVDQWTNFVDSGTEQRIDCNNRKGTVGVIAEDELGAQSDWVSVTSKNKATEYLILRCSLEKLIYRFPFFEKILNQIIQVV
ncbi:MAG: hypothetical protein BV456_12720 [Thermoplasmata archaeon M8B2D]|nr:MAG: hypothetical protein BV456_12720 [Thermoplasmata archaeon M8B2D]